MAKANRISTNTPLDDLVFRREDQSGLQLIGDARAEAPLPQEFQDFFRAAQAAKARGGVGTAPFVDLAAVGKKVASTLTSAADKVDRFLSRLVRRKTGRRVGDQLPVRQNVSGGSGALELLGGPVGKVVSTAPAVILKVQSLFRKARGLVKAGKVADAVKVYDEAIVAGKAAKISSAGLAAFRAERNVVKTVTSVAGKAPKAGKGVKVAAEGAEIDRVAIKAAEDFGAPIATTRAGRVIRSVKANAKSAATGVVGGLVTGAIFQGFNLRGANTKEESKTPLSQALAVTQQSIDEGSAAELEAKKRSEVGSLLRSRSVQRLLDLAERRDFPQNSEELAVLQAINRERNRANKVGIFETVLKNVPGADPSRVAAAIARSPRDVLDLMRPVSDEISADNAVRSLARDMALQPAGPQFEDVSRLAEEIVVDQ